MTDPNRTRALSSDPNRTQLGAPPVADPNRTVMGTGPSVHATQTIKPVQCPVCKTFNPAGMIFCVDCGLIFERSLPDDAFGAPAVQLPMLVEASGREHPIRPGATVIGREGDVQLADGRVSRRHAQIDSEGGALSIKDLGSTNGTKVAGVALQPGEKRELRQGDTLSFGGLEARLSMPGEAGEHATQTLSANRTAAIAAPPRVEQPAAWLVGEGEERALRSGPNTFGRKADNDVSIQDPYVSGRHGVVEIADDGVYLTDTGSTNGTLLNEARLSPNMRTKVGADDVIRLGSLEFRIRLGDKDPDA
jgi:pSer/pThr/pTyr-binding forkhead associated (FHA) protein